jgi:hypothetical protein
MLSERAKKYLSTLRREPATVNEADIIAALNAANVPTFQPVIHFQINYGGYVQRYGFNVFRWGILHDKPVPCSFFKPNKINFFYDGLKYYITCANCHGSDHWTLDSKGMLYWCGHFKASSFEKKLERDAFVQELSLSGKLTRINFEMPAKEVIQILVPQLQDNIVEEASDHYQALYLKDGLYAAVGFDYDYIIACIVGDETPEILKGIPFRRWPASTRPQPTKHTRTGKFFLGVLRTLSEIWHLPGRLHREITLIHAIYKPKAKTDENENSPGR